MLSAGKLRRRDHRFNGNHGLGVAAAAQSRGIAARCTSRRTSRPRRPAHRAWALPFCSQVMIPDRGDGRAPRRGGVGKVFISPYNDVDVMAGQARSRSRCTAGSRRSMPSSSLSAAAG